MVLFGTFALLGYPLLVLALFIYLSPRAAVTWGFLIGWLYLPLIQISIPGLPDYGKFTSSGFSIFPMILLFDPGRFSRWRFSWTDGALVMWIFAPFASALANGLGVYDGLSGALNHFLTYGVAYVAGRLYLADVHDYHDFAQAFQVAAISYIPLCLFEMRMSPQLHQIVYGSPGRASYVFMNDFGPFGWQPTVFMNSVFELGMMMVMASMMAFGTWRSSTHAESTGVRAVFLAGLFVGFTLLMKKATSLGLLSLGLIFLARKSRWLGIALVATPVLYMFLFITGLWRGEGLSEWVRMYSDTRAESLQFRIDNDARLIIKALERPFFGWGGWGGNRVYDEKGQDISITDSFFMISMGTKGVFGLTAQTLLFAMPCIGYFSFMRMRKWKLSSLGIVAPIPVILSLHLIDNLFNAFPNPFFPMFAGGLTSIIGGFRADSALTCYTIDVRNN